MSESLSSSVKTISQPNKRTRVQKLNWGAILTKFVSEHKITLTKDYTNEHITRETKLEGICLECKTIPFSKTIRNLVEVKVKYISKCLCITCTKKSKETKCKSTWIKNLGVEHPSQSQDIKDQKILTSMKNHGVPCPLQSQQVKDSIIATNMKNHGVVHNSQRQDIKDKKKSTCMTNNGVEHPMQSQKVRDKSKVTHMIIRGVEYPSQCPEVQDRMKKSLLKNHGVEHALQCPNIRAKSIKTCMTNHGVEYPLQSPKIQAQTRETNMKRYGVEYLMQNADIADKSFKSGVHRKDYTFPSGRVDAVQGDEPYALAYLLNVENIPENDIVTGTQNVPVCYWYDESGNKHRYYVDIFILSQQRCIEVKSTYYLKRDREIIFAKRDALENEGYLCDIWVYDGKKKFVECL